VFVLCDLGLKSQGHLESRILGEFVTQELRSKISSKNVIVLG
jgi:hypothetical protein